MSVRQRHTDRGGSKAVLRWDTEEPGCDWRVYRREPENDYEERDVATGRARSLEEAERLSNAVMDAVEVAS